MSNIFEEDSDSDVQIRTDNEYAKSYNTWRKKEELNKLKTKYGDDTNLDEESSSSSSDDEEGVELTEEIEKDFFKTLSCLKNKDPRIYNENVNFFQDNGESKGQKSVNQKKKKDVPMYLKDYERKLILEKGGVLSDDEDAFENKPKSATYVEEQEHIKESLKNALDIVGDEDDGEWGGLFQERKKTKEEKQKEASDYKKWLAGEKGKVDEELETELKPLKEYWNNPDLDEGEKFLRDYVLNRKFLDNEDDSYIPTYDEIIHDSDQDLSNDEDTVEKQEEFEHKYNFRFEEPDQDFIKRYPRTMENSVRKTDDRRKIKRQETKERKKKEKEEKMKELKKLQELKHKEIEEKLEKLKEITGNSDIGFADDDIEGDFDPDAHDKRMQALFNEHYYQHSEEDQKPLFPEIDEELEIENWDRYEEEELKTDMPHCEDEDFNMDCDYDPNVSIKEEIKESTRGNKKRKRKSLVAKAISRPKPKFDPNDRNYEKYFEEYYKLDCEDIIGDIPCRFKYRTVVPNDFGLSVEDILLAKDRELNKWCSLKKAVQIRPDHVEKYEQIAYKKKSENVNLKKKILPSLFSPDAVEENDKGGDNNTKTLRSEDEVTDNPNKIVNGSTSEIQNNVVIKEENTTHIKKKKRKTQLNQHQTHVNNSEKATTSQNADTSQHTENEASATNSSDGKRRKKKKKSNKANSQSNSVESKKEPQDFLQKSETNNSNGLSNKHNKNQMEKTGTKRKLSHERKLEVPSKKVKKNQSKNKNKNVKELAMSDARLSAYGINPKKFKNKLKYGKNT